MLQEPVVGKYIVVVCALAKKGTQESYELLQNELNNDDGFKRRAAFAHLRHHKLWAKENREKKMAIIQNLLNDENEFVAKLAATAKEEDLKRSFNRKRGIIWRIIG